MDFKVKEKEGKLTYGQIGFLIPNISLGIHSAVTGSIIGFIIG